MRIEGRLARWLTAACVVWSLSSCSKGGTTLDEDANRGDEPDQGDDDKGQKPCGNGLIGEGEDCDGNALDGVTCVNLGFTGGTLYCDPVMCTFDTTMCTKPGTGGGGSNG
jgi:hypothetical protein